MSVLTKRVELLCKFSAQINWRIMAVTGLPIDSLENVSCSRKSICEASGH